VGPRAAEEENRRTEANGGARGSGSDAEEKHRDLTDSIFNDIVDRTRLQDDKEPMSVPVVAAEKAGTAKVEEKEEELPKRRRQITRPVAVDDQLQAEVSKEEAVVDIDKDRVRPTAAASEAAAVVANGNNGDCSAKNNKTDNETAPSPASMPAKSAHASKGTHDHPYRTNNPLL
jgi:hypothetical protein